MRHATMGRLGVRPRAGLMGCAVLFGALLLVPQDVLADPPKTASKKSSGSSAKSSPRASSGSSSRSAGSRSSSARSGGSSSKSSAAPRSSGSSRSSSSRSGTLSRSKPSTPSTSRPRVAPSSPTTRPSGPATRSPGSTRPSATGPSIRPPDRRGDGPPRHLINLAEPKTDVDMPGRREGKPEYSHRPQHRRHHHFPWYYPFYYPHRYFGYPYGWDHYGLGYYGRYGYPPYLYGPFGYMYFPEYGGYGGGYRRSEGGTAQGDGLGGLDLNVKPKDAIVYVDGDPIGPVDRYDGYPSYLWLEPGTYNLSFYLEGYQTLTVQHTVLADVIIAIKERLQPGVATPPAEGLLGIPETPGDEARGEPPATVGRLLLTIRPPDAAVYLDGHFLGTAGELAQLSAGLVVEPGRHVLELVRPGYQTEEVPLTVPAGDQIEIDLELQPR